MEAGPESSRVRPKGDEVDRTHKRKRTVGYITLPLLLLGAVIMNLSRGGGEMPRWLLFVALAITVVGIPVAIWADSAFRSDKDT